MSANRTIAGLAIISIVMIAIGGPYARSVAAFACAGILVVVAVEARVRWGNGVSP